MSTGSDTFPFHGTSSFEGAIFGYDKRQVDRYIQQVESEIAALAAERDEAYGQITLLNQHLAQAQQELLALRRYATPVDPSSYRHLGPKVEQILALAEEQAAELRQRAEHELSEREAAVAQARAEIDAEARDATRDFEIALAARRAEEEKAAAKRRDELATEIESGKAYAAKLRSDVDAVYAATQQEAARVGEATRVYADRVRSETEAHAALVRQQVAEETATLRAALE